MLDYQRATHTLKDWTRGKGFLPANKKITGKLICIKLHSEFFYKNISLEKLESRPQSHGVRSFTNTICTNMIQKSPRWHYILKVELKCEFSGW